MSMTKSNNEPKPRYKVEMEQVWIDCDRRTRGRESVVKNVSPGGTFVDLLPDGGTRLRRVRVERMYEHSTGFRLRKDFIEKAQLVGSDVRAPQIPANSGGLLPAAEA